MPDTRRTFFAKLFGGLAAVTAAPVLLEADEKPLKGDWTELKLDDAPIVSIRDLPEPYLPEIDELVYLEGSSLNLGQVSAWRIDAERQLIDVTSHEDTWRRFKPAGMVDADLDFTIDAGSVVHEYKARLESFDQDTGKVAFRVWSVSLCTRT